MAEGTYVDYFCLSLFSVTKPVKLSTFYQILIGKRTASILFNAHQHQLSDVFSLFPNMEKNDFRKMIKSFILKGWIAVDSEGNKGRLTEEGQHQVELYFTEHFYPNNIQQLHNGKILEEFWARTLFVTQIFSELLHGNNKYIPIEKDWQRQLWVKQWIHQQTHSKQTLAYLFAKEWSTLLQNMETASATLLAALFTGHNRDGRTKKQLSSYLNVEKEELNLMIHDSISLLYMLIERNADEVPLFFSLLKDCQKEGSGNLSQSAGITASYLQSGLTLEEVAKKRNLKISTVSEHVIELAIVSNSFQPGSIIPEWAYEKIQRLMEGAPSISFQEVEEKLPNVLFLWYRLIQIERSRFK